MRDRIPLEKVSGGVARAGVYSRRGLGIVCVVGCVVHDAVLVVHGGGGERATTSS